MVRVSRRFELLRVRVTEGKITVTVRKKTTGNSMLVRISKRFESASDRVI